MLRFMKRVFLLHLLLLGGCGLLDRDGPTPIDGSSPETFEASMEAARYELGPRDRLKFEAAIRAAQAKQFARSETRQEMEARLRRALHGKTAPEIVAKVDRDMAKAGDQAADAVFDVKREVKKLGRDSAAN